MIFFTIIDFALVLLWIYAIIIYKRRDGYVLQRFTDGWENIQYREDNI